ncbi:MAG: RluA family pseudouridine synthase [Bacilli bacterium]|nr:RluA family pseudouridine synthase [Bacilli bacterium]
MKLVVKQEGELLDYLYNNLDMPKKRIKQYLTHGAIYVNNNKTTKYNYKLVPGMKIVIDTDNKGKAELPFDILFEDDNIIVVNKPSGLLTIATAKEKEKTLYHIVREYLVSKNRNAKVFIVHRLDKDTSGIVVLAKNQKIKNKLQENWNDYVSLREYTAVVHGHLKNKEDRIVEYLKENKINLVYAVRNGDGKEAITNYKVIKENSNYSLVDITIETGRKNQIRVAFNNLNHPIVGDNKYGNIKDDKSRLYLHANRLKMYYPELKKDILFETNIPNEFKKIMNKE